MRLAVLVLLCVLVLAEVVRLDRLCLIGTKTLTMVQSESILNDVQPRNPDTRRQTFQEFSAQGGS